MGGHVAYLSPIHVREHKAYLDVGKLWIAAESLADRPLDTTWCWATSFVRDDPFEVAPRADLT
jgi:hypothetical protein